jgi:hypothetical protein
MILIGAASQAYDRSVGHGIMRLGSAKGPWSRLNWERNMTSRSSMLLLGVGAIPAVAFTLHDLVMIPPNRTRR